MTPNRCGHCGAATIDRYLCAHCETTLADQLQSVPVLLAELDTTLARLGARIDGGSDVQPVPDMTVSLAAAALRGCCFGWANELGHTPKDRAPWDWMWRNTEAIAVRYPQAGTMLADIQRRTTAAWRKVDRPPDRWYAGPCDAEITHPDGILRCGRILWANIDDQVITCPACRTRWDIATRRAYLLAWAENHEVTVTEAASALTLMTRTRVSRTRIANWITRGLVTPTHTSPRYRVRIGDLIPIIARGEPTDDREDAHA